ncbi:MAG TPA: sigma-70 family RNA polymerase sigma factor [Gaiellaceae bacterium]
MHTVDFWHDWYVPDIEALYREHRAGLVRLVERELHDRHDAEDVVQTAFLEAQRALERGTIPRHPRAWLAAIALNAARGLRHRHVSANALEEYAVQEASRLPEITAALKRLPKSQQAALVYRDVLGLSYAETAAQMGATVPAVTMLIHRARAGLRKVLGVALPFAWPWKWLRGGPGQAGAAKAAGAVVLAGGLATAGVVTGQHAGRAAGPAAPGMATATQQPAANFGGNAIKIGLRHRPQRRDRHERSSALGRVSPSTAAQIAAPATPGAPPPKAGTVPGAEASRPTVDKPTLSLPTLALTTPTLPATIATIETPVITTTVAVPTIGLTVPTPIATVTVNIP